LDTAQAIAKHHRLEVKLEPDLKELNIGELDGIKIDDLGMSFSELLITSSQGELLPRVPGGESLVDLQQRTWRTTLRLVGQHTDGVIAIVCHYFTILTIISSALNLTLNQLGRLTVAPGSISILTFDDPTPRLVLLNDTCHLATG
jgi:broad specificity phosphatase PhoE